MRSKLILLLLIFSKSIFSIEVDGIIKGNKTEFYYVYHGSSKKTYTFEKRHNFMMDKRKQVIGYMVHTLNNADSIFTEELFDLSLQLARRISVKAFFSLPT